MAPDLNTVPESPRSARDRGTINPPTVAQASSRPSSRRTSAGTMGPPPAPATSSSPSSPRQAAHAAAYDNIGVGVGPGPIRHPRPMTPAELHLELEKEQEGIVNRLTRELSLLRQQTASVASTASSASEFLSDHSSIIPTSARRHRSSSNLSTRSITAATTGATSVSGVAPARETSVPSSSRPSMDISRPSLSRENSMITTNTGRHSITASPSLSTNHLAYGAPFSANHHPSQPHRQSSLNLQPGSTPASESFSQQHPRSPSFSAAVAAARYEEAAYHRAELDAVKRENELLRQRIRDLEKNLGGGGSRNSVSRANGD